MTFQSQLPEDMSNVFLNTSEFGETIEFLQGGDPGQKVTINAIVDREVSQGDPSQAYLEGTFFEVWISNDATKGRTAVDPKKDTIRVAKTFGGSLQDAAILEVLDSDSGAHHFSVRL